MKNYIEQVKEFKLKAGQSVPQEPTFLDKKERELLARLAMEETLELISALGVQVRLFDDTDTVMECSSVRNMMFHAMHELNMTEVMDACCDIFWVGVAGPAVACGISDKLEVCLNEVGESNLSKFIDGHKCPNTGKWIKGPSYKPAEIAKIMELK